MNKNRNSDFFEFMNFVLSGFRVFVIKVFFHKMQIDYK
jgi:hypothetical protein